MIQANIKLSNLNFTTRTLNALCRHFRRKPNDITLLEVNNELKKCKIKLIGPFAIKEIQYMEKLFKGD